jgi:hypothetical protein
MSSHPWQHRIALNRLKPPRKTNMGCVSTVGTGRDIRPLNHSLQTAIHISARFLGLYYRSVPTYSNVLHSPRASRQLCQLLPSNTNRSPQGDRCSCSNTSPSTCAVEPVEPQLERRLHHHEPPVQVEAVCVRPPRSGTGLPLQEPSHLPLWKTYC